MNCFYTYCNFFKNVLCILFVTFMSTDSIEGVKTFKLTERFYAIVGSTSTHPNIITPIKQKSKPHEYDPELKGVNHNLSLKFETKHLNLAFDKDESMHKEIPIGYILRLQDAYMLSNNLEKDVSDHLLEAKKNTFFKLNFHKKHYHVDKLKIHSLSSPHLVKYYHLDQDGKYKYQSYLKMYGYCSPKNNYLCQECFKFNIHLDIEFINALYFFGIEPLAYKLLPEKTDIKPYFSNWQNQSFFDFNYPIPYIESEHTSIINQHHGYLESQSKSQLISKKSLDNLGKLNHSYGEQDKPKTCSTTIFEQLCESNHHE